MSIDSKTLVLNYFLVSLTNLTGPIIIEAWECGYAGQGRFFDKWIKVKGERVACAVHKAEGAGRRYRTPLAGFYIFFRLSKVTFVPRSTGRSPVATGWGRVCECRQGGIRGSGFVPAPRKRGQGMAPTENTDYGVWMEEDGILY
jgi:hypothetical protein